MQVACFCQSVIPLYPIEGQGVFSPELPSLQLKLMSYSENHRTILHREWRKTCRVHHPLFVHKRVSLTDPTFDFSPDLINLSLPEGPFLLSLQEMALNLADGIDLAWKAVLAIADTME